MLRDYSIEITESDDFDYAFVGADDILDKSIGLEESIEYGLKNIDKYVRLEIVLYLMVQIPHH